jgi:hypothetical protein
MARFHIFAWEKRKYIALHPMKIRMLKKKKRQLQTHYSFDLS